MIFCDGDFWHGRDFAERVAKLARGHNATYWIAKIRRNVARDRQTTSEFEAAGWVVLRFWETAILRTPAAIADRVAEVLSTGGSKPDEAKHEPSCDVS